MQYEFEDQYFTLLNRILNKGYIKNGRNGQTMSMPGLQLAFDVSEQFPILTRRRIFWTGVAGEYAAFIRGANHIDDFKAQGCNFWDSWADSNGNIKSDYGNAWRDYNDTNQMEVALNMLKQDPESRRIIIDAWRPDRLNELSLPCCHYNYQFYHHNGWLDLIWTQRSADWMIGVPSDAITATIMLNCFAQLAGLNPRNIIMNFGDAHIYSDHIPQAQILEKRYSEEPPTYTMKEQTDLYSFKPSDIKLVNYECDKSMKFELKV